MTPALEETTGTEAMASKIGRPNPHKEKGKQKLPLAVKNR